jgi:asparagine synthase (glutamine-hydrolysing)
MAQRLVHRGPDDEGTFVDLEAGIGLGFRRLSILELTAAGRQPMASADGRFVIVFNGEIYNHASLREGLGVSWRGRSDTEALVESVAARGIQETLTRADGMFALAVWDRALRQLTLARDRFGEKPLYIARANGAVLFASEPKVFTVVPAFDRTPDPDGIAAFLRWGYIPAPHTAWRAVHKLGPGELLAIPADRAADPPARAQWWNAVADAEAARAAPFRGSAEDAVAEMRVRLRAAVASRSESDVPLGAFLSGGIDSSAVVAAMVANGVSTRTFTIAFPGSTFDEAPHATAIARQLGTRHHVLPVSEAEALATVPRLVEIYDEPFADASAIPTVILARLTRQRVTVALSGDGGDELFAGYPRHHAAAAAWRRARSLPARLRGLARAVAAAAPTGGYAWGRLIAQLTAGAPESPAAAAAGTVQRWPVSHRLAIGTAPSLADDCAWPGASALRTAMLQDLRAYLPDNLMVKMDRAAMAASLEPRAPLLAIDFVRFSWSLPDALLTDAGGGWRGPKALLRRVLAADLPPKLFERPKQGFEPPLRDWLRGGLRDWAEALLARPRLVRTGLIARPELVRAVWAQHVGGRRQHTHRLWTVLMLMAWAEREGLA